MMSCYVENRIPLKPVLEGGVGAGDGCGVRTYAALQTTLLHMSILIFLTFVCSLFPRQPYRFLFVRSSSRRFAVLSSIDKINDIISHKHIKDSG